MTDWYENDSFWTGMEEKLFSPRHWQNAAAEVDYVLKLAGTKAGAGVLDLCCGPGRHTLELARRGYSVTGVDRTEVYLKKAREAAEKEGLEIRFVQADMREFAEEASFDLVINLYTSFGYFSDPEDDGLAARNIFASLVPGGKAVFQLMGKEILARIYRDRDWYEQDGVIYLEERQVTGNWSVVESRWIAIDASGKREYYVSNRLYSGIELRDLFFACGFTEVGLFGNLTGTPYDQNAEFLVAVADKQEV